MRNFEAGFSVYKYIIAAFSQSIIRRIFVDFFHTVMILPLYISTHKLYNIPIIRSGE